MRVKAREFLVVVAVFKPGSVSSPFELTHNVAVAWQPCCIHSRKGYCRENPTEKDSVLILYKINIRTYMRLKDYYYYYMRAKRLLISSIFPVCCSKVNAEKGYYFKVLKAFMPESKFYESRSTA